MHILLHLRSILSTILIGLGMALLVLPNRWIEAATGFDPDFGSGSLEFALAFGVLGAGLLMRIVPRWRASRSAGKYRMER